MESRQCAACSQTFQPRPQVPQQGYCSAPTCQRERRRRWQLVKRQNDSDYHDNQERAQRSWRKRHPSYWREYRRTHSKYRERNRLQQHERNARRHLRLIAKIDASKAAFPLISGIYRISPMSESGIAKMDAWTVEITLLSAHTINQGGIAKRGRDRRNKERLVPSFEKTTD